MHKILKLFFCFLPFRIFLAVFIQTLNHPDEYWQGPEVAHKNFYHYGNLSWEWDPNFPLRSPFYPYLLSLTYYFAFDNVILVRYGPRVLQAIFASIYDITLVKIAENLNLNIKYTVYINNNIDFCKLHNELFPNLYAKNIYKFL